MQETMYFIIAVTIIVLTTLGTLKLGKIQGLRSRRGVALGLLMAGSWVFGWVFSQLFIPLGIIVPFIIQVLALTYVAKLPVLRAVIITVLYIFITIILLGLLASFYMNQFFSPENIHNL